ncbi:MAG: hypothetical protein CML68_16925 [Rhodobacteraceae bacterium]|nr:hypothetical protein [Paracoccaceae bacterium]
MTQASSGGATPPSVAGPATQSADLSRNQPVVIGIFGPANALNAMVRLPGGRTVTVAPGEKLRGRQVLAIDDHGVILAQGGRQERLSLP